METTLLIAAARAGDKAAEARLFETVYADLHRLAKRHLRDSGASDTRATSMVHEVYLRLARGDGLALNDRAHFFAVATRAMRQIVIDHVRQRLTAKRGGGVDPVSLDSAIGAIAAGRDEEVLQLDAALERLAAFDSRLAHLVELRFFGGLRFEELVEATGIPERTLKRDWTKARAFLYRELAQHAAHD